MEFYISRNISRPTDQPFVTIKFADPVGGHVRVRVYNTAGELIKTLFDETAVAGARYEREWDGRNNRGEAVASGVYLIHMTTPRAVRRGLLAVTR